MLAPDVIPLPIALPLIIAAWVIWLAPAVIRARRAAHRSSDLSTKENDR